MSKLNWDRDNERLYETGVDHVVLYPMNDDGTYGDGVAWNGATGVTESPEGADANDIYADNIKYLSLISKENWKGTIKAYTYPDVFAAMQGEIPYSTSSSADVLKALFGQQARKKFAISWRSLWGNDSKGDQYGYKIHLAYGLSAAPSEKDHATENDSPEATEFSWEISSIPASVEANTTIPVVYNGTTGTETLEAVSHVTILSTNEYIKEFEQKLYGVDEDLVHEIDDQPATIPTINDIVYMLGHSGSWPEPTP